MQTELEIKIVPSVEGRFDLLLANERVIQCASIGQCAMGLDAMHRALAVMGYARVSDETYPLGNRLVKYTVAKS